MLALERAGKQKMRKMQVFVVTRDGRKSIYDVDRFGKVSDLKVRIGRNLSVPMCFSRLAYKGRILPNDCVLEDVGIMRMSTLELFWQPLVFSPKQIREKELDIEKLEQKHAIVSSMTESYDQMVKSGGLLAATSQSKVLLHKDSVDAFSLLPIRGTGSVTKLQDIIVPDDDELEDLTSVSSDELEFLAAYRRPRKGVIKKTQLDDLELDEMENLPSSDRMPIPDVVNDIGIPDSKLHSNAKVSGKLDGELGEIQLEEAACCSNLKKKSKKSRKKK